MGIGQLVSPQKEKTEEIVKKSAFYLAVKRSNGQKMQKCFSIMLTGKYLRNIGLNSFFCVLDIRYH